METQFAVVAFLGGFVSILSGWSASGEPFSSRKFLGSFSASVVYAVGVGMVSGGLPATWPILGLTFVSGAAANLWGKDVLDVAKKVLKPR